MSYLRGESLRSFKYHNPSWDVRLSGSTDLPIVGDNRLQIVHRSDWTRYSLLFEHGGFYFDTDIIFLKPIPEEWLDASLVIPQLVMGRIAEVAVLGSRKGHNLFLSAMKSCARKANGLRVLGYWDLGSSLLSSHLGSIDDNDKIALLPVAHFFPVEPSAISMLWNPGRVPELYKSTGVHWIGGDPLSSHMEPVVNEEWIEQSDTVLADLIRRSRLS